MRDQGIGSWPTRRARMTPDKVALMHDGRTETYVQLDHRANRLAHGLRERGIRRGDRVAYLGLNSIDLVETLFATAKLGAVFVPVNTRLTAPELRHVLTDSDARLLVWQDTFHDVVGTSADTVRDAVCLCPDGPGTDALLGPHDASLDEKIALDELFMIQYTSGTSGRPKGVMLTHANVVWNVFNLLIDIDLGSDEVALVTAPLFHTAALNQVLLPTVLKGGTALIEAKFDPDRTLQLIEEYGVTMLFGVTSMYLALVNAPAFEHADLRSLRHALSGGAPIPESLLRIWLDRGLMITQGYGLTETSPGATMLRRADGSRKVGSAGTACFFTDVRVVTSDLEPTPPAEPGEVLVQGPNVTSGYWRNDAATSAAFVDDWLRTGDLAVQDDEGYLRIVGRLKDIYISGGENVSPAEVEEAIHSHPAVAECVVVGIPDPAWGEVGLAAIVVREGAQLDETGILDHLDGRVARYKIPKAVRFVDELPHTASGKVLRSKVAELL